MFMDHMARRLAAIVVVLLVFSLVFGATFSAQVAYASDCPFEGSGWQEDPYIIDSPSDLVWLQQNFGNTYNGRYFLQTVDLDMAGVSFSPIGNGDFASGNRLTGTYDGGGRTIRNLTIVSNAAYVGLFGYLEGGHIKSLTLQDVTIRGTADGASVGAFAGDANTVSGNSMEDCAVIGTSLVEGPVGGSPSVGGLVGRSANNNIANCYFAGTVKSNINSSSVGGIAGYSGHSTTYLIQKCYFSGTITGSLGANTGGIVGNNLCLLSGNFFLNTAGVTYGSGSTASNSGAAPIDSTTMMTSTPFVNAGWDLANLWQITEGVTFPLHRSTAVRAADIQVVLTEAATDNVIINRVSPGYTVRIYDSAAGGSLLGSAVAVANSVTVGVGKLPVHGTVYVSMQTTGRVEGPRTAKAYAKLGLPIVEGFESGNLPAGWVSDSVAGGLAWTVIDAAASNDPLCSAHAGVYVAKANSFDAEGQSRLRMENGIALPDGLTYKLVFWMYHDVGVSEWADASGEDRLQAEVSSDGGTSWVPLGVPIIRMAAVDGWERHEYSLNGYVGNTVMIGFLAISGYWNNMYIDGIEITGAPATAPTLVNGLSFYDATGPASNGRTAIALGAPSVPGNTFRYRISSDDGPVAAPLLGADVSSWTAVTNGQQITAAHGQHIGVAEVNSSGGVVQFSDATAVVVDQYSLTYAAGANGSLTGTSSQTVNAGSDGTEVVAVANVGYHFVSWSDGISTAARTDRGVTGAINVTANFAANIAITVAADAQSKVYGTVDPALTYSLTSGALELGDSFSGALSREAGEGVGSYAIGKGTLSAGPKYNITLVGSSLTITKRSLEVTANSLAKTYGGADPALTYGITQGSLVPGDEITGSPTRAAGEGVGSYQVGRGSLAVSANYELNFIPGTFTVNPAALTVRADDKAKTYGGANPPLTATYSGFVLGQDPSALGGALTLTTSANVSSGAGAYPITPSGLTSSNYAITFVDGTLTVNPAPLTVTASDKSKTYGSANPGFTATYSGFVLGQDPFVLGGALVFVTSANSTSGVGTYAITPSGLTSSNYTITFVNGTLTVSPASLTVTADDKSKPYGSANPALTATYSGFVLGQDPSVLGGALVFVTPAVSSSSVGTYAIMPSGLTSSNYAIAFVDGTLTVDPASLSVTAENKSKTYGNANPVFTVSYSGFALGQDPSALGGTLTLTNSATVSSGAGAYPITPSGLTSSNYAITFVDGTLLVNPAALTVTAEDKSRVYGGADPGFTATYSGFVLGQDVSVLGGALTFTTPAVAGSDVGAYDITPSGLTSSNYAITFVDGTLTVTPTTLSVSADNKAKTYGQPNPAFTASYTGFVAGDGPSALGGALTFTTPAVSSSVVGSYPVTPSGLTSSNYTITFVGGTLQVNTAALTVAADDKAKTYGSENPALTASYSGFVLGQDPSALGGALVLATTATASSDVGTYPVTPSGLASSNYAITFVDGTLEVTPATLTVTAENQSKSYGSDNPAFTATYSGFRLGQDPSALGGTLAFSTPAVNSSDVGTYAITPSGLTSSNYAITYVNGTLQVTPVALTVTADNKGKTYGSDNPTFTATYSGFVLGQNPSVLGGTLTFTTPAASGSNVGSYSIAPSGLTSSNYTITFVNGTLQVTPAALTVRAEDKVKTYGDANPDFTAAYSGFVLGQNPSVLGGSLTFTTLATTSSDVATYAVTPSGLISGNYAITFVDGTLTVDRATLTVTADNKSKTYGSDNPALTASYSGFVLGQNALVLGGSLTFTTPATSSSDVATYAVTPSGLTSSNYAIIFVDGTLAVNRAALTVTAENKSKTYGSDNPAFTAAYSGFVLGQGPSVLGGTLTFTTPAANGSNVGSYAITPSGLTSSNYAISFVNGALQVTPTALTVRAENKAKTYGDANPAFTAAYSGFVLGQGTAALGGTLTFTTPATTSSGVGTYAISPSGLTSSNYAIAFASGQLQVNQAALTVTADDKSRAYGEADPAFTVRYSGFVLGQTQSVLGGTLALNTEATVSSGVGAYSITPSGLTSSNYAITFVDGVLQVEPALLTATADMKSKVYGEADPVLTYRVTAGGLVNGDSFTGMIVRDPGENVGNYAIAQGTLSAGGNYLMTYVPGELVISKRPLIVTADAISKVYGESDPTFTYQVTAGSLVNGDAFSGALGRFAGQVVGDYQIQQGSLTAGGNYAITYIPANLTITKKPINAAGIGASDRVYDGGVVASLVLDGAGLDGAVIGDTVALSTAAASGAFASKHVGAAKTVTVSGLALSGPDAGNYALLPYTTMASVTEKAVHAIDIIALNKVYDGKTEADLDKAAAGLSGVVGGDDLLLVTDGASGTFADKNVGATKTVTVAGMALGGADAVNYALQPYTTSATITKKAVYATGITAQNRIYDGNVNADLDKAAAGLSGVVSGDDLALVTDSAVGTFADKNVGAGKTVSVAGLTLAGTDVDNYALQIYTTPATITAKTVSAIEIAAIDKVYDRSDLAALDNGSAGLNGVVDGDSVTLVTVTTGTFDDENVGSAKAVTVSGLTLAGADAGNYDLQAYGTTATITPKPVSPVGIAAADKVYDSNLAATLDTSLAVLDGVVTGDELMLVTTGASGAFGDRDVGVDKTVTVTGLVLDGADILNYQLLPYSTQADITARPITVTADAKTKVYGEDDPVLTYQLTSGELVGEDAFSGSLARAPGKSVDEYEILQNGLTAGGNYHLTYVSAKLTITSKSISAAGITAQSKYWDGVTAASLNTSSASLVGLEVGDDVHLDVSKASGAFADAGLGVSKPVTVTDLALTGADAGNYQLNPYTTTASIVEEPDPPKPPTPPTGNSGVVIIVNGETQDDSATATTSTEGEKTVTTVVIDPDKLDKRLEEEGENATVTVPVNTGADVVVGELTGQTVKNMETKSAVLEIKTERVTYTLPASQISIDNVAAQLGEAVSLQDVKVSVQVAEPPADTVKIVEDTANRNSYQVVVKPVEFTITCTHQDKTVEVSKFNGYVERMVAVPEGVDPAKITTGVVLNADGTFSHVPTTIVLIDGKYYAKINSLTNSIYSVIWNPIEFQDMYGHWARGPVNDMGSRLVMSGESSSVFGPSRAITRGEFAATIVKALGLRPEMGESPFVDLKTSHKHYGYILTAYQYGIMGGLPGNRFGADSELTREEAMAIVVSAMRLTKLSRALSAAEVNTIVAAYADSARVSGWARNVVAACLKSGIIGGRPGQLIAPKDIITRAEAAAIMQRFLRQAGLI